MSRTGLGKLRTGSWTMARLLDDGEVPKENLEPKVVCRVSEVPVDVTVARPGVTGTTQSELGCTGKPNVPAQKLSSPRRPMLTQAADTSKLVS